MDTVRFPNLKGISSQSATFILQHRREIKKKQQNIVRWTPNIKLKPFPRSASQPYLE
jgi:hypothetical protein